MWVALLHCDRDGNSPWILLSAAFSAPGLNSEPSSATACLSVLNEARCANQEGPGHCWLTLHRAGGQGWKGQSWDGSSTAGILCPSRHSWACWNPWVSWPGSEGREQHVPRRTRFQGTEGTRGGGSSPQSKPCSPTAVTPWASHRPCTRVCAVVVGGRKMVALSPLGDPGAVSNGHSPRRTG